MNNLLVSIDYIKSVNYSLCHNHIQICRCIEIKNDSFDNIENVQIKISGKYLIDYMSPVYGTIRPDKSLKITNPDITLKADELFNISEGIVSSFVIEVFINKDRVYTGEYELEIMAFDQWLGTSILPQCLSSFCMPNQPAINNLILKASSILNRISGSSSFIEYQDGNAQTVLEQVAAIFAAIHDENIVYRSVAASYEQIGQRITLADQILENKLANCIELTLLMASALEAVGINSGVVLTKKHAFLAVWLDDLCSQHGVLDDSSFVAKKCSDGIAEMTVIECTELTKQTTSFEFSQEVARKHLLDIDSFEMYVDIKRCRLEGIKPLPARTINGDRWIAVPADEVIQNICDLNFAEHTKYDLDRFNGSNKETSKFDIWERKLLDFSLRNNFLNLSLRTRAIQLISFEIGTIEDHLQDGEEYSIMPMPDVDIKLTKDELLVRSGSALPLTKLITNDIEKDKVLHTYLKDEESQQTLRNIYRASRIAIEETGSNSLYLAIGLLRWYEKKNSPKSRYAPILLLPVEILYKRGRYSIRKRDEEISLNITLMEYIRQYYGIMVKGIDPLPIDDHGVDVPLIFAQIRDAIREQNKWDIEEECVLGTFSFSKFLMWNDIHVNRDKLVENSVVASLVNGGLNCTPKPINIDLREEDKSLTPDSLSLPVPVDSSQMAAILEAGKGSTFILYGPPGTGKSQTITNLISNALYQGKRVLFVAEKMAALNVVQSRLEKVGLGPFCLELHSNKVVKRHILEQLHKSLENPKIAEPGKAKSLSNRLFERRKKLISYLEALHNDRGFDGLSLYECIQEYEEYSNINPLDVTIIGGLETFKKDKLDLFKEELYTQLPAIIQLVGQPSEHPLKDLKISFNGLSRHERLIELLGEGCEISAELLKARTLLLTCLGESLPDSESMIFKGIDFLNCISAFKILNPCILDTAIHETKCKELEFLCEEMMHRDDLYDMLIQDNRPEFFEEDMLTLLKAWSEIQNKWFIPRYFAGHKFINKLKFFNKNLNKDNIEEILNTIQKYQIVRDSCKSKEYIIIKYLSRILSTEELKPILKELPTLKEQISRFAAESALSREELVVKLKGAFNYDLPHKLSGYANLYDKWGKLIAELYQIAQISWNNEDNFTEIVSFKFNCWKDNITTVYKWVNWCELRNRMLELGLTSVVEAVENKIIDPKELADSFFKGLYRSLAEKKIYGNAELTAFEGLLFDQQIQIYKKQAIEFQELSKNLLYYQLSSQVHDIYECREYNEELGLLLRNISNGARGMSIRQLLDSIPHLLPILCPCMLMSPMSVAQYIDLNQEKFDLVVFDEASQMPTSEAVGAIARGKSLIVVGDPKQMPPTSFFSSNNIDEEDEVIDDLESILQDCQALGMPSLQLNWHYRSRHESLIAFSNHEYYEGELITFPSTDDQITKVSFVKVDGVYEKGGRRCNKKEAETIVEEVVRRLKDENLRNDSIGIIAFSSTQQNLIEDMLSDTIERDKDLTLYAESMYEPIFVKNLENVQGDERDIILFSIGYGPDDKGKISMNFGPLNKVGGERRLNVAVSRARKEMIIYSTMSGDQINLNNTRSKGVEGLKHFLEYAEKQILFESPRKKRVAEKLSIHKQIAKALAEKGFETKTCIGLSEFKIDIAVIDPNDQSNYILALLLDGDTYLATQTSRDREIVQPSVLNNLNWNVARIWSVDWFRQPDVVINRIVMLINKLIVNQEKTSNIIETPIIENDVASPIDIKEINIDKRSQETFNKQQENKKCELTYNNHEFSWSSGDMVELNELFSSSISLDSKTSFLFRRKYLFIFIDSKISNKIQIENHYSIPANVAQFHRMYNDKYGKRQVRTFLFIYKNDKEVSFLDEIKFLETSNNSLNAVSVL